MKLILLRHGESLWNLENKFTGWKDISLTEDGKNEAKFSGEKLLKENIKIQSIHTSLLKRAIQTSEIVCNNINFKKENINFEWRLNERHYGALEGLNKSETAAKYGEKQVKIWRRSFDIPPPFLDINDDRHPKNNPNFNIVKRQDLPVGESLKMVIERLMPFWNKYFKFIKSCRGSHLIVAHSNSLRAIVKILEKMSTEEIISVNIPTGVPLVYEFDQNFDIYEKKYLIDEKKLFEKQELIKNQGKVK